MSIHPPLSADEVLTTTRAARRRLDLSRPVPWELVDECLHIAAHAPSASNGQQWHWIAVEDPDLRSAIANLYRASFASYADSDWAADRLPVANPTQAAVQRSVMGSVAYLAEHLHEVPTLMIPAVNGRFDGAGVPIQATMWGSILPAAWSFMLAARARGLGTAWTTFHLAYEQEVADLLGIPYAEVTQAALIPMAYLAGDPPSPAHRKDLTNVVHRNGW